MISSFILFLSFFLFKEIKKSGKQPTVYLITKGSEEFASLFATYKETISLLSYCPSLTVQKDVSPPPFCAIDTVNEFTIVASDLKGIIDPENEVQKLEKKLQKLTIDVTLTESKIADPLFKEKTPAEVQEALLNKVFIFFQKLFLLFLFFIVFFSECFPQERNRGNQFGHQATSRNEVME